MKILAGFDGSEGAWDAVALARRTTMTRPGAIVLVEVAPLDQPPLNLAAAAERQPEIPGPAASR